MALSRFWSGPAGIGTVVGGDVVNKTVHEASTPGYNAGLDSLQVPTIVTAPPNSSTIATNYTVNTASVATVVQNTLGYDALYVGYFAVTTASVANFQVGVGSASPVAMSLVAGSVTSTTGNTISLPAYVPSGYYYSVQASQANGASVPTQLTIVSNPV